MLFICKYDIEARLLLSFVCLMRKLCLNTKGRYGSSACFMLKSLLANCWTNLKLANSSSTIHVAFSNIIGILKLLKIVFTVASLTLRATELKVSVQIIRWLGWIHCMIRLAWSLERFRRYNCGWLFRIMICIEMRFCELFKFFQFIMLTV